LYAKTKTGQKKMKLTPADEYFGNILEKGFIARKKREEQTFQDEYKL
jgi:hypothetical protein